MHTEDSSSDSNFFIVYPGGDRSKIAVVEISHSCSYEINDYAIASKTPYSKRTDAAAQGRVLAVVHGLVFEAEKGTSDEILSDEVGVAVRTHSPRERLLAEQILDFIRIASSADVDHQNLNLCATKASKLLASLGLKN